MPPLHACSDSSSRRDGARIHAASLRARTLRVEERPLEMDAERCVRRVTRGAVRAMACDRGAQAIRRQRGDRRQRCRWCRTAAARAQMRATASSRPSSNMAPPAPCTWTSMKPGATRCPRASIALAPGARSRAPTAPTAAVGDLRRRNRRSSRPDRARRRRAGRARPPRASDHSGARAARRSRRRVKPHAASTASVSAPSSGGAICAAPGRVAQLHRHAGGLDARRASGAAARRTSRAPAPADRRTPRPYC